MNNMTTKRTLGKTCFKSQIGFKKENPVVTINKLMLVSISTSW